MGWNEWIPWSTTGGPANRSAATASTDVIEVIRSQVESQAKFMRSAEARGFIRATARAIVWESEEFASKDRRQYRQAVEASIESATRSVQAAILREQWDGATSRAAA